MIVNFILTSSTSFRSVYFTAREVRRFFLVTIRLGSAWNVLTRTVISRSDKTRLSFVFVAWSSFGEGGCHVIMTYLFRRDKFFKGKNIVIIVGWFVRCSIFISILDLDIECH